MASLNCFSVIFFGICTELGNSTLHYAQLRPHCARKTPLSENIFAVPRDRYVTLTSPPQIAYSCANIGFCAEIYKLSFPEKSPFKFLLLLRCLEKMKHFRDFFLEIWKYLVASIWPVWLAERSGVHQLHSTSKRKLKVPKSKTPVLHASSASL